MVQFYTLDVFTNKIFSGNQLAVFPSALGLSTQEMQKIAIEFNFSETVFVLPPSKNDADFRLRIFTPGGEIPFAGHPTIGTAFLLAKIGKVDLNNTEINLIFEEQVGYVPVTIRTKDNVPIYAELTAPSSPHFYPDSPPLKDLAQVLSLDEGALTVKDFSPQGVSCGLPFLLIPLDNLSSLANAKINLSAWERVLKDFWAPHLYPFVKIGVDSYQVRMFAPGLNIIEDPATGSAATAFAGYLAKHKAENDGRWGWQIFQGVEMGRPSRISAIAHKQDNMISTIKVGGESVIVTQGELNL